MAYSKVKYTYTSGGSTTFSYSNVDVLGAGADPVSEQLDVYLNDALLVLTLDYTINTGTETITLTSRVASGMVTGDVVVIQRDTKLNDRYVDWTNNAGIDESDLDLEGDQHLFIEQELSDELDLALKKNVSETYWDGQFLPSANCSPATDGSGWTTLNQVQNLLAGGETASLGTINVWCFDGTGSQSSFLLNGAASNTNVNNLFVSLDGITLCPCDDDVPFSLLLERAATAAATRETTFSSLTGAINSAWDSALTGEIDGINQLFGRPYTGNPANNDKFPGIVVYYEVKVTSRDAGSGPVPTIPTTFVGTASECQAFLDSWTDQGATDTHSGTIRYHHVEAPEFGYTYDAATRALTITPAPPQGVSICVRQLTGTVAVDLGNLSLDGSELQNDSIELRHIDMAGETYYIGDESTATANSWPAATKKLLVINNDGTPYLGLINSSFITNFTSAVTTVRLNQLTVPNASVNMNTNKITNLLAGTAGGDAVNWTQLNAVQLSADTTKARTVYGGSTAGNIAPDLYYNSASNIRLTYNGDTNDYLRLTLNQNCPPVRMVETAAEGFTDNNCMLRAAFRPRWLKFIAAGEWFGKRNDNGNLINGDGGTTYTWLWDVDLWEIENGFAPFSTTTLNNNTVRVYSLPRPQRITISDGAVGNVYPMNLTKTNAKLYVESELGSTFRVWLELKGTESATSVYYVLRNPSTVNGADTFNYGSIQLIACKGF
jgi:hypothetical protein